METTTAVTAAICLAGTCGPLIGLITFIVYQAGRALLRLEVTAAFGPPSDKEKRHEWQ